LELKIVIEAPSPETSAFSPLSAVLAASSAALLAASSAALAASSAALLAGSLHSRRSHWQTLHPRPFCWRLRRLRTLPVPQQGHRLKPLRPISFSCSKSSFQLSQLV